MDGGGDWIWNHYFIAGPICLVSNLPPKTAVVLVFSASRHIRICPGGSDDGLFIFVRGANPKGMAKGGRVLRSLCVGPATGFGIQTKPKVEARSATATSA